MSTDAPTIATENEFSILARETAAGFELPRLRRKWVQTAMGGHVSAILWGRGSAAVSMVAGDGESAHSLDHLALALNRPLVALDRPGHGYSSWWYDGTYRMDRAGVAVSDGLASFAGGPSALVGFSLGGLVALAAAARRPKLVTRLILVDATPSIDSVKARASTVSEVPVDGFPNHDALAAHVLLTHPEWSATEIERIVAHDALTRDDGRVDWRHDRDAWT